MHQSMHVQKPSALMRQLEAGEGTIDRNLSTYASTDPLISQLSDTEPEWACPVDIDDIVTATLQDAKGDPKSVEEVQSCSDWPS